MMEGRLLKTIKNVLFATINQGISLILNVVNRTLFIWILGIEYLGINGLFADVLIMLSLADLGVGTAMVFSYYKPLCEGDENKIAQLTQFYKKIYSYIAIVVAVLGVALMPFLQYLVNLENDIANIYIYYLLMVANTVASYMFVYKTSIINADQKNYIVSKYLTLTNVLRMVLQIVILTTTKSYCLYLVIQVLMTVLNNILTSKKADKLYPYINTQVLPLDKKEKKGIFENIKSMALYKIALVIFGGTDNTLISVLVGTIWTGIYSNYNLVINTINSFINILYNSATASIGNVIVSEEAKKRYEIFGIIQTFSLFVTTVITVCLYSILDDLIYLWLGQNYMLDGKITITILLNFYFNGIVHPIWSFREACGLYKKTKYIMVIAAVINFCLSVLLGLKFGIAGILIASLIARISTYFWYEPQILFCTIFRECVSKYYIPLLKNCILTVGLCCLLNTLNGQYIIRTWGQLLVKGVVSFGVVFFVASLCYRKALKSFLGKYVVFRKKV